MKSLIAVIMIALAYWALAKLGLQLAFEDGAATLIWPASGLAMACVVIGGPRTLPGVWIGAVLANLTDLHPVASAVVASGNTLEAALAGLMLRRAGFRPSLLRLRDGASLLVATLGSGLAGAGVGVTVLYFTGTEELWLSFRVWYCGDVLGMIIVGAALLAWSPRYDLRSCIPRPRQLERLGAPTLFLVATAVAFFGPGLMGASQAELAYLPLPFMIWTATRFGSRGAVLASLALSAVTLGATLAETGPLYDVVPQEGLLRCWVFLVLSASTALLFGTAVEERSRAESTLAENETKYRSLFEDSRDAIALLDAVGRIREANRAYLDLLGIPLEQARGSVRSLLALRDSTSSDPRSTWRESVDAVERTVTRSDGTKASVSLQASPFVDADGRPAGIWEIARDVSAKKAEQHRSVVLQRQLAHVLRIGDLGELASGLAHELSQPLTAISNYTSACLEITRDPDASPAELEMILGRVSGLAHQASGIIARLRKLVRRGEAMETEIDLADLIRDTINFIGPEARSRSVKIELDLAPEPLPLFGDAVEIQQLLINLLMNAVDAVSGQPRERRKVEVQGRRVGEELIELTTRDYGPGLEPQVLDRIFEPFFTTKPEGIGLGLPISRTIAEAHGGRLEASSNDQGAQFRCVFPAYQPRLSSAGH